MWKKLSDRMGEVGKWLGFTSLASAVIVIAGATQMMPWIESHRGIVATVVLIEMRLVWAAIVAASLVVVWTLGEWTIQTRDRRIARNLSQRAWDASAGRYLFRAPGMPETTPPIAYLLAPRELFDAGDVRFVSAICSVNEDHGALMESRYPTGQEQGMCCKVCAQTVAHDHSGTVESLARKVLGSEMRRKLDAAR